MKEKDMSNNFEFELGQLVKIEASDEQGTVCGRAQYLTGDNSYLLRYKCADGRAVEAWWTASALQKV